MALLMFRISATFWSFLIVFLISIDAAIALFRKPIENRSFIPSAVEANLVYQPSSLNGLNSNANGISNTVEVNST